jgi:hypothetical protein
MEVNAEIRLDAAHRPQAAFCLNKYEKNTFNSFAYFLLLIAFERDTTCSSHRLSTRVDIETVITER